MSILLSFDIGHSSIGWSVITGVEDLGASPDVLGCGSVIFPADDCLASKRRSHRRTRRNIRATRLRIGRIKQLLSHLKVLSDEELNRTGHSAPHVLAARTLIEEKPLLTWVELWSVIRWYAHNRGYDGNSRWACDNADSDDTDKEKAALELMKKHGTEGRSMAETICATLGIDLNSKKQSSFRPYKTINAAFPRKIVRKEILDILNIHKGHLPKLDSNFIDTLIAPEGKGEHLAWKTIEVPELKLPKRYFGGLLFGQLVPRFDNRIIGRCPISGDKIPNKATREFLDYRWAMILANLRVDGLPLSAETRKALNKVMASKGRMTSTELKHELEKLTGSSSNNVDGYFDLHPDSAEALILDPALALYNGEGAGSQKLKPYWATLPELVRKRACGRWKKGRIVNLQWMLDQCAEDAEASKALMAIVEKQYTADQKKKKPSYLTHEHFLNQSFAPAGLSGRAPYSRKVMREAVEFVLSTNRHPTEATTDELCAGPLYRSKEVLSEERKATIQQLTNNHLIRQRLDILLRLVDDILEEYAGSDARKVSDIVVEVTSDLQTYSGLSAKEMQGELTKRLSQFKSAVKKLEEDAPNLTITGSLIRKCRIAMDMDWKCPFTLKCYDVNQLGGMEREHIIPYADRPTNALDALVLTFPEVNRMKAKRLAHAFVEEFQGKEVEGAPHLTICSLSQYEKSVKGLKPGAGKKKTHPDDYHRQTNRLKWMLLEKYEPKDHGFSQGALTQTSHLNRLSARQLEKRFIDPVSKEATVRVHTIPGQITAETRKAWRLLGTMAKACPEIKNPDGKLKTKTEIRGITHLHHALDAVVLGLTHTFLPGALPGQFTNEKGAIWKAMLKRNKTPEDQELLMHTGMFAKHYKNRDDASDKNLDVHLIDIPKELKEQVAARLEEKRVVQHIPADQSDFDLEETTWRYLCEYDGQAVLLQRVARDLLKVDADKATFGWQDLPISKASQDLLEDDFVREKLDENGIQSTLIERGLMKIATEPFRSLVGVKKGKLNILKAVRVIKQNANYGIALGKSPKLIPFHAVPAQLSMLRKQNGGRLPLIIRKGSLISVKGGTWKGFWRVTSVKESKAYGLSLDLVHPHTQSIGKNNAKIPNMIEEGLEVLEHTFVGVR